MNRNNVLILSHVLFGVLVVGLAWADISFDLFERPFSTAILFTIIVLPFLIVISWKQAFRAPTRIQRNYFNSFRWLAIMLWLTSVAFAGMFIYSSDGKIADAFYFSAKTALKDKTSTVSFSSVTSFQWGKVFIFTPYTSVASIDSMLGYNWSDPAKDRVAASESEYLIVFVQNGKVVQYSEFLRRLGDFELLNSGASFSFGSDIFTVKQSTNPSKLIYIPASHF